MFWLIVLTALAIAAMAATLSSLGSDGYGHPEIRDRISGRA